MRKEWYRIMVTLVLLLLCFLTMIKELRSPDLSAAKPSDPTSAMSLKVDSMMKIISSRDSLIVTRDTVVYRVNKTKEIIREYINTKDTVVKIKLCDSLAVRCDSIASQYSRNDSLFRQQIASYVHIISIKDTIINNQNKDIAKLNRRVKFVATVSAIAAAAATAIILK